MKAAIEPTERSKPSTASVTVTPTAEQRDDGDRLQHAEQIVDAQERRLGVVEEHDKRRENDEDRIAAQRPAEGLEAQTAARGAAGCVRLSVVKQRSPSRLSGSLVSSAAIAAISDSPLLRPQVVHADDRMAAHDRNDVGGLDRLFDVAGRNQRRAVAPVGAYRVDDVAPRADVDALKRLVEQQQAARRRLPAADHDLLLVAAGEEIERVARAPAADAELCE